jgi:hypothetical protein
LAQSPYNQTDWNTFTITTYYPAPYGVYRNMRLYPSNEPTAGVEPGVMYYNQTQHVIKFLSNTTWVNMTGGTGGGYWSENATTHNIYNTNSGGKVGIGEMNPNQKLVVSGGKVGIGYNDAGQTAALAINGNVGIGPTGMTVPTQALDVNGKIRMRTPTSDADGSDIVVTKGYLTSAASPTLKIVTGAGVNCASGTQALMKCFVATLPSSPCVWGNADSAGSWSKVMCGQSTSSDGSPMLVYGQHTSTQCGSVGKPYDTGGGVLICQVNAASCASLPSTGGIPWTQYNSWYHIPAQTQVASGTCSVTSSSGCGYIITIAVSGSCTVSIPESVWSNSIGSYGSCPFSQSHSFCWWRDPVSCSSTAGRYGDPDQVGCY